MSIFRVCIATVAVVLAAPANSQGKKTHIAVQGVGAESCGSYVLAIQKNGPASSLEWKGERYSTPTKTYVQWIAGYVSAHNAMKLIDGRGDEQVVGVDLNGMALWIKNFCEKNPTVTILNAASTFIGEHSGK